MCLPLIWLPPFASVASLIWLPPFASVASLPRLLQSDPGQLFSRPLRAKQQRSQKQQQQQRKPGDAGSSNTSSNSSNNSSSGGSRAGAKGGSGAARLRPSGGTAPTGGAPSWKRVFGGLIPLAAKGHLQCPTPIVKMRAAIAALKPVRDLRPQALPIR